MTIDSYDFGEIVIAGKTYTSDVIIFPHGVDATWWRKEGHELSIEDLAKVVKERPQVLVVGTGNSGLMRIPLETRKYLESLEIELIAEVTQEACRIYNEMKGSKRVVAALHLTC